MKKLSSFLLLAVIFTFSSFSQNNYIVDVNEQTDSIMNVPVNTNFNHSYSQMIYYQSDIGLDGDITSISFYWNGYSGSYNATRTFKIWMKEDTTSMFTSTTDWENISSFTQVLDTVITPTVAGWITFNLTTPFHYSNTTGSNIVVTLASDVTAAGNLFSSYWQATNVGEYRTMYYNNNNTIVNPASPPTATQRTTKLPNIRLNFSTTSEYCPKITSLAIDTTTSNSIALFWPEVTDATSYAIEYKKSSQITWTVASSNIMDTFYVLTDLDASAYYDVRITTNCSNSNSLYRKKDSILTKCQYQSLPYTENFDYGSTSFTDNLPCWINYSNSVDCPVFSSNFRHSGTKSLYVHGSSSVYTMIVLPLTDIETNPLNTLRLRLWMRSTNSSAELVVGTVNSLGDSTSFVPFDTLQNSAVYSWQQKIISFYNYTGTGERIALKFCSNSNNLVAYGIFVDDLTLELIPECSEPTNLVCNGAATETSATLSWSYTSTMYNSFVVSYCNITDALWDTTSAFLNDDGNFELTNLAPHTYYYWTVGIICAGDTIWSLDTALLSSGCDLFAVPYNENFDSLLTSFVPNCWDTIGSYGNYPAVFTSTSNAHSGNKSLMIQSSANKHSYIIMPKFEDDLNTLRLQMFVKPSNLASSGKFEIGYMTNASDTNTFVSMKLLQSNIDWETTSYKRVIVDFDTITATEPVIAFRHLSTSSFNNFFVDDISVTTIPYCTEPTDLEFVSIDNSSVTLTWSYSNDKTYNIYYKDTTQDSWTVIHGVTMGNNATTYTIQNLTQRTTYQCFITMSCDTGELNSYDTLLFTTTMIPATLPFTTDFSDQSNTDFIFHNGTCANKWYIGIPSGYTNNALYVSKNGTDTSYTHSAGTINVMKTFTMPDADSITVEFDMVIGGESFCDYLKVLLTPPGNEYQAVSGTTCPTYALKSASAYAAEFAPNQYFVNSDSLGYARTSSYIPQTHFAVSLANPSPNGTGNLYFVWRNDGYGGNTHAPVIQNLSVRALTCPPPTIVFSNATSSSINYTISSTSEATSFEMQYKPSSDTSWSTSETVTDLTTNLLTDLQANTDYQIRVRAICDETNQDYSSWSAANFRTKCSNLILPYTEDFDSYNNNINNMFCWNMITPIINYLSLSTFNHHSNTTSLLFRRISSPTNVYSVLPSIDAQTNPINTLRLSFYMRSANLYNTIIVGAMSDREDTTTFVAIDTVRPSIMSDWQRHIVDLSSYQGTAENIALKVILSSSEVYLDDLKLETVPSCPAISERSSLHAINTTENSAVLAFTDSNTNHTQWKIYYKEASDNFTSWQNAAVSSMDSTLITGLNPAKQYIAFIVPVCSGEESTDTSDYCLFTTMGVTITSFPYIQDFENVTTYNEISIQGTGLNQWYIGTATAMENASTTTNHSMYISNDNGISNSYTITNNYSHSYAIMTVSFGSEDEYNLSFDYNVRGEISNNGLQMYDFLAVFMLDTDTIITPSRLPIDSNSYLFISTPATGWRHCNIVLDGVQNTTKHIAFVWKNDISNGSQPPAAVDNISIASIGCITQTSETISASICDGQLYTLNGQTYTTAGIYYDTLTNAAGCDSVITLILTVNPTFNLTIDTTILQGESIIFNNTTYTESGTYTTNLTTVNGCDSTVTLNLTVSGALIDVENGLTISLYPNPTSSNATLSIEGLTDSATIILTDQQGKEISRQTLLSNEKQTTIDTYNLASGVYYISIIRGSTINTQKLIKQ